MTASYCSRCARLVQVTKEDAQSYADENGLFYWETSAKTNVNVNELFQDIAKRLPRAAAAPVATGGITLSEPPPQAAKRTGCC